MAIAADGYTHLNTEKRFALPPGAAETVPSAIETHFQRYEIDKLLTPC